MLQRKYYLAYWRERHAKDIRDEEAAYISNELNEIRVLLERLNELFNKRKVPEKQTQTTDTKIKKRCISWV